MNGFVNLSICILTKQAETNAAKAAFGGRSTAARCSGTALRTLRMCPVTHGPAGWVVRSVVSEPTGGIPEKTSHGWRLLFEFLEQLRGAHF